MNRPSETDVLIVGSGIAGSLLAESLLARGKQTVTMLEAGPAVPMRDQRHWLDYVTAGRLPYDGLSDKAGDFKATGEQPWYIPGGRLIARGGSTLHWGGWCPRMKPEDFELKSRIGTGGLDWPFKYADLQPYYQRAEEWLQVAGDSSSQDPPRLKPYPFEAPPYSLADGVAIEAMEKLGISYGHVPVARNGNAVKGMPPCQTTGTCKYCPIGGRFTGDQPLDRLKNREGFTLLTASPVTRLLCDKKRRIHGVQYMDLVTGRAHRLIAEKVILCAGALETPKLMLISSNRHWPKGIGNDTDHVGRHLIANPYFYARAARQDNPNRLAEEVFFVTLGSRHWDTPEHQREGKFFMNRGESPLIKLRDSMSKGQSRAQLDAVATGMHVMELVGTMQAFSYPQNRVMAAEGKTRFGLPRTHIDTPVVSAPKAWVDKNLGRMRRILEAMGCDMLPGNAGLGTYPQRGDHAMCTTRMSASPSDGVVDTDLKVHGTDNLYIVSNGIFPSGSPANPSLTLAALTFKFIDALDKT